MGFFKGSSVVIFLLLVLLSVTGCSTVQKQEQVSEFFDGCLFGQVYLLEGQVPDEVIIHNCIYLEELREQKKKAKLGQQPARRQINI